MVTGLDSRETLTVLYDRDCGICTGVARALVRLDSRGQLRLEPLQGWDASAGPSRVDLEHVLHVVDARGRWFSGGRATVEIARRVPVLRPVAWTAHLPGAMTVLDLGYKAVADHRRQISSLLGLRACPVPRRNVRASRCA